jgi:uncharacterized repeat protein (TIGR01451 family)
MSTKPPGSPDIDLTFDNSFGVLNGAVFMTGPTQSSGTGTFNTFVEIQNTGIEQGYNTDASAQFDEKGSHNVNHSILLAQVPIVVGDGSNGTIDGVTYREFLLDLNESTGAASYISLDALQIWQEEAGNLTNFTAGIGFAGTHTNYLAYNLDAGGNHWVALNDGLSHGSGQSDVRILIPDSYFINDAAHRYVTLYSEFGVQAGWGASGGFEEWGLSSASSGPTSALSIHKVATVPGGTADVAGEVIDYAISVSNTGNTALTGITVTDPSVSNLAAVLSGGFNIGDTNLDNQLSAGETWQYTANHIVTQDDIDTDGGGTGVVSNTATADSIETNPVSASASVAVDRHPGVLLVKTPDVATVDAAGDVINYTITFANTGNATLNNPHVDDSQVNIVTPVVDLGAPILGPEFLAQILNGDYNVGDTNQNGVQDPGETFQYANVGDTNQNHVQDPGETFLFTNVGDTNQNGSQDTGETFQYYNVGDTNHNGVEDAGETFQFSFDHSATTVDADHDTFNDGDTNKDGVLNVGETWQFSVSYTVTQDDIDNGGVVNPALTHDNTATGTTAQAVTDQASASVLIDQNPHVTLVKSATVPGGTADNASEVIAYTIDVTNDGNMTLTSPVVTDPSVSDLAAVLSGGFNTGDTDHDGKIDIGETWHYTANHTVTQDDMDAGGSISNTASVTTGQGASDSDSASITVEQHPHVVLDKVATVPGGTADSGETISYAISVTNDGNVSLTIPVVTDPSVSNLAAVMSGGFNAGDADHDGKIDVGETWQYSASHTVTNAEFLAGGNISNTASVTTDQGATSSDSASVAVTQNPAMTLVEMVLGYHDLNNNDVADAGDVIDFSFLVHNTGNTALNNIVVSDPDGTGSSTVAGSTIVLLAVGASDSTSWHASYTLNATDVGSGHHDVSAVANSDEANAVTGVVHVTLLGLNELVMP